jgi:membrane fusion protein
MREESAVSQPSTSLYRQQAINAHFSHQYGEVFMLPKVHQLWLAGVITVLIVLATIFISTQPFAQTVEVKGWIATQTNPLHIRAKESAGIIKNVFVHNGDTVVKGQAIISISRQSLSLLGDTQLQQNLQALRQAHQLRINAIEQKQQNIQSDVQSMQKQALLFTDQIIILKQQHDNIQQQLITLHKQKKNLAALAKAKLATANEAQQAQLQWLTAENNRYALKLQQNQVNEQLLRLANDTENKQQQIGVLGNQKEQAMVEHNQALAQILQSLQYTLYATSAGKIDNLFVSPGDSVSLSQQLMQILPQQQKLKSMLSVPANQAGFLLPTQQVKVKVDGFPYQKYGAIDGTITHVSKQVLLPSDTAQMPIRLNSPAYMIEVELASNSIVANGETWPLSSGMTINASIQLDQPSILEWLLGPLYSALGA